MLGADGRTADADAKANRVTQQNAALVEEMARAAGTPKLQADDLVQAVNVFEVEQPMPA